MSDYRFPRNYSDRVLKVLFGRNNRRCAFPGCLEHIVKPGEAGDEDMVFAQIAHIYSRASDGPRPHPGNPTVEEINGFDNLLLVCMNHHYEIDQRHGTYTVEKLRTMKAHQIGKFRASSDLTFPKADQCFRSLGNEYSLVTITGTVIEMCEPVFHSETGKGWDSTATVTHKRQSLWFQPDNGPIQMETLRDSDTPAREGDYVSLVKLIDAKYGSRHCIALANHDHATYFKFTRTSDFLSFVSSPLAFRLRWGGAGICTGLAMLAILVLNLRSGFVPTDVVPFMIFLPMSFFLFLLAKVHALRWRATKALDRCIWVS